jgi:CheY-like chemotaxis protein
MTTLEKTLALPIHVVVEIDDELERSILKSRHFEEIGAGHHPVANLEDARGVLNAIAPDQQAGAKSLVIVLDLMFQDTYEVDEGITFIKEVRRGNLGVHPLTPIVILSNVRNPPIMEAAFSAGANAFFSKSDTPQKIVDKLKFYLGQEQVESIHTCEVVDLDLGNGQVRVRLRAESKWILERWMPVDFCPPDARIIGGAFFWENTLLFQDYGIQYRLRARPIETEGSVERLLDPEW